MQITGTFPELSDNMKLKPKLPPKRKPAHESAAVEAAEEKSPMSGGATARRPVPGGSHLRRAMSRRTRPERHY